MTATDQDFTTYQGDAAVVVFTVVDGAGAAVDISTATEIDWNARRNLTSAIVLEKKKTTGGITFVTTGTDGKFQVTLTATDTAALTADYIHIAVVTDSGGSPSTVATGIMSVGRSPIATYSGDPSLSNVDAVRFLIGDTDPDSPLVKDEAIAFVLGTYPNVYLAAAQCCRAIAATFAQKVNKRVGDLSINYSDKTKNYLALAEEFDTQGEIGGLVPYSGGTSRADKDTVRDNSDRVRPPFRTKQFDNNRGGSVGGPSTYDLWGNC